MSWGLEEPGQTHTRISPPLDVWKYTRTAHARPTRSLQKGVLPHLSRENAEDASPLTRGAIALLVEEGRLGCDDVGVRPVS